MDTQILYYWAQFHNLNNLQKRELFSRLISERLNINCEAHIYRILTRFTFQTLRKKYGETYQFTQAEQSFNLLLKELTLYPSTVHNWYYTTIQKQPLKLVKNECATVSTGSICECCISEDVKKQLDHNYELRLASKRIYQTIIKAELFKEELCKGKVFLDDVEIRRILRRLVEYTYYKKGKEHFFEDIEVIIQKVLQKKEVKPITVLKWFYLLQHHPELLKEVHQNKISPDDIFVQSGVKMMKEIRGGIYATDCNVSN
mgnify:CR=1 FL=1